jgi:hypothetical protein
LASYAVGLERRTKLRAYGLNLLRSLLGVLLMLVASFLWTPPLAWFAACFLAILLFTLRTLSQMTVGLSFTVVCTIICGGLLEYNSMYFGFRFVYPVANALLPPCLRLGKRIRCLEEQVSAPVLE